MKGKKEKIAFVVLATFFALSIFVVSVIATLSINAKLSGSFNFSVPSDGFFFLIEASAEGSRDPVMPLYHEFNQINKTATSWSLDGLNFKENAQGEIDDIVFVFNVTNNNPIEVKGGRVKISYELVSKDSAIILTPSVNLENGVELAPLAIVEDPSQTDNKATFTVTLSPVNKIPTSSLSNAEFQYRLMFEFVL